MRYRWIAMIGATALFSPLLAPAATPTPIRIGVLPTIFRERTAAFPVLLKQPLLSEIETQTGFDCDVELSITLGSMCKKLGNGQLQFALCHGFEFAWMQLNEPKLKPLTIVAPSHRPLKAYFVVASANPAKCVRDLTDKIVAIPWGNDPLVNLFADRNCRCDDKPLHQYVRQITKPLTAETALHELYEDKVQAAIVDGAALQAFAERYPARAKLIRTLFESEPFPLSVVVYHDGAVDPPIIKHFRKRMEKARTTDMGRLLLSLLHCDGFEEIPPDFASELAKFVKRYPQREEGK